MSRKKPLAETLTEVRASIAAWFDRDTDRLVRRLREAGAADGALKVGDRAPDFLLPSAEGRLVRSSELFGKGPVVLSFYRGAWCPYCSAELNALADVSPRLHEVGASVVAITPEVGGVPAKTKRERCFDFEILCDIDNGVAMAFGLVFRIPDDFQPGFRKYNVQIPTYYGNDSWMLPIAATYVVGKDGVIAYAYVNLDHRERCDPEIFPELIAQLNRPQPRAGRPLFG